MKHMALFLKAFFATAGILVLLLMLLAGLSIVRAEPTSDQWMELVMALRAQDKLLDDDDRKFLFRMTNLLTATDNYIPDSAQQKWIIDIAHRVGRIERTK